ncbi:hypothetical protein BDN67DRAFT_1070507 [Paxillus ammoniavirescens]|nr:hypothetical protein BDN67DRAFT_1070507 [Paxillus ammoniavirescens]
MSPPIITVCPPSSHEPHSESSPSSPGLYVPVHKRNHPSGASYTYVGSSSASSLSPSTSSRMFDPHSSPSSPGLYVPVRRHNRSSGVPSSSIYSRPAMASSSPPLTSSSTSPALHLPPTHAPLPIYTHADLVLLSASHLARLSPEQAQDTRTAYP